MIIEPLDFFLLRMPTLPQHVAEELHGTRSLPELVAYLHTLFQAPELRDAVFIASESLHRELASFLEGGDSDAPQKLLFTLYKYAIRMATRSTPFGLFAGVASGNVSDEPSAMRFSGITKATFRLDMAFSAYLSRAEQNRYAVDATRYRANASLLRYGNHYRYMGYRIQQGKRHYQWMRAPRNPLVDRVIAYTDHATRGYDELMGLLKSLGLDDGQRVAYLMGLADAQLLVSETEPVLTNHRPMALRDLSPNTLNGIPKADFSGTRIQADLVVGMARNQLSRQAAQVITTEIRELLPLNQHVLPTDLADFRRRFTARYEGREVRLLEALDPDRGIGYGDTRAAHMATNDLLNDLGLHQPAQATTDRDERLHRMLQGKRPASHGWPMAIELSPRDVQALGGHPESGSHELPSTGYVMGQLIAPDAEALDQGHFLFNLQAAGGNSALPLLARFCHLDTGLETRLRACAALEEAASPDVVFAEIVFLPDDRIGNVMLRPSLRRHELALIGHAATPDENTIPVADLWVSVMDGHIALRSRRLGKIVIPRLSCAHNYRHGTSVYRFLCDLQHQSHSISVGWDWGGFADRSHLPRVSYKHIVLSRARWRIPYPTDPAFATLGSPTEAVAELRRRHGLPARVVLAEADNELLLDLGHFAAAEILMQHLKRSPAILLEDLATSGHSPVTGPGGIAFANEIILPFKTGGHMIAPDVAPAVPSPARRSFPPGSEWAYMKLYVGRGDSERLLTGPVTGFIAHLKRLGALRGWFFVRYADPDYHIRLRVRLSVQDDGLTWQTFTDSVNRHFGPPMDDGLIHRIQYDTYDRELERYGHDTIARCEAMFQLDSEATLAMLPRLSMPGHDRDRWAWAMVAVDDLLEAMGLPLHVKLAWIDGWREQFIAEFRAGKSVQQKLDLKFREHRPFVEQVFNPANRHAGIGMPLADRFSGLKNIAEGAWITRPIAASLAHMFINRHFHTDQREMELVVYHFLAKTYRIMLFRNGGATLSGNPPPRAIRPVSLSTSAVLR